MSDQDFFISFLICATVWIVIWEFLKYLVTALL
jgi:hypothetical protein